MTACVACPAGFDCSSASGFPPRCGVGKTSAEGDSGCSNCPQGEYCANPATSANSIVGFYSPAGSAFPLKCPAGSYCPLSSSSATACDSGKYSTAGSESCQSPASGTFLPTQDAAPQTVPDGYKSSGTSASQCSFGVFCKGGVETNCASNELCVAGSSEKDTCPNYMRCASESQALQKCGTGQYLRLTDRDCTTCPAGKHCESGSEVDVDSGYYSPSGVVVQFKCPAGKTCSTSAITGQVSSGQVSAAGVSTASDCPLGYACPDPAAPDFKFNCAALPGYYADSAGLSACKLCEAGYACAAGSSDRVACTAGSFSEAGQAQCTTCPEGSYCSSTSKPLVQACRLGSYSSGGQSACTECPANHACSLTAAIACPSGMYSNAGEGFCWHPPAGVGSVDGSTIAITHCDPGFYKLGTEGSCTECPAGHSCAETNQPPVKCVPGTYQDQTGQIACKSCTSGQYSLFGQTSCFTCPAGHSCADTHTPPIKCAMGTYATTGQTACTVCTNGHLCKLGSSVTNPTHSLCPAGHYCSHSSHTNTVVVSPCSKGTYNPNRGAGDLGSCLDCPQGMFCPLGTEFPLNCTEGGYCTLSSGYPTLCQAGKFLNMRGATSASQCEDCPAYYYCPQGTTEPVKCPPGYWCPAQSTSGTTNPCPAGTYGGLDSLSAESQCTTCPKGHYCPEASIFPTPCPRGSYETQTGQTKYDDCYGCPYGQICPFFGQTHSNTQIYCELGGTCPSGYAKLQYPTVPCDAGKYSDSTISSISECLDCPAGHYCQQRVVPYIGTLGSNSLTNPWMKCTPGHYCPAGTSIPIDCPAGTYSPDSGNAAESDCLPCPPGKYCLVGSSEPTGSCAVGHYCLQKATTSTQYACPAGTYQPKTGAIARGECLICPLGHYCLGSSSSATKCPSGTYGRLPGLSLSSGSDQTTSCLSCPEGWYCASGTIDPLPCQPGTYSNSGASSCSTCTFNHYCPKEAMGYSELSAHQCDNGYICPTGTNEKPYHPHDTYSCPAGYYCQNSFKTACPQGKWQPLIGASSEDQCLAVPAGYYCAAPCSNPFTTANECQPGYYCPQGSTSTKNTPCPAGKTRSLTRGGSTDDCGACPAGFYCPDGTTEPHPCPLGSYCTPGIETPVHCPVGTFGHQTGLRQESECTPCWGGRYCSQRGLSGPSGHCAEGYYCTEKATTAAPVDGTTGNICPAGGYCEIQSKVASNCLPGTYNPSTGKKTKSDCISCTAGKYCSGSISSLASDQPEGDCWAGYYCPTGSSSPTQETSEAGYYSEAGAADQTKCAAGTYNPFPAQSSCTACTAGKVCPDQGMTTQTDCSAGYYCLAQASAEKACPAGTYNPHTSSESLADCLACPPGKYCKTKGLSTPTGDCQAGYFCKTSATTRNGIDSVSNNYGVCPVDHYCPSGTGLPISCGDGKYSNGATGLTDLSECSPCPGGSYCQAGSPGTSGQLPTGTCEEGYFCSSGSKTPTPASDFCIEGQKCPAGSSAATKCPDGSFQPRKKQGSCITCPAGHFCGSTDSAKGTTQPVGCNVAGHYCPEGTSTAIQYPCPIGTYSNRVAASSDSTIQLIAPKSASECLPCDPGYYCNAQGLSDPAGLCDEGYYCLIGSPVSNPGDGSTPSSYQTVFPKITSSNYGGRCSAGSYCPQGTPSPQACPPGYFCPDAKMGESQLQVCPAGSTCPGSTITPTQCTQGHYCPAKSTTPTPCSAGTYNPSTGSQSSASCQSCDVGKYCGAAGLSAVSGTCHGGYICSGGASVATPELGLCPVGFKCPAGATSKTACSGATEYQDEEGQNECKTCPEGYECTDSTITKCQPVNEGASFYCPASSRERSACPTGTINVVDGSTSASDCESCPPGSYCPTYDKGVVATKIIICPVGSYCSGGTTTHTTCPQGFYCPLGSNLPIPCTAGFYCASTGLSQPTGECSAGYYCSYTTITASDHSFCSSLSTCERGSISATESDCPKGAYCPAGTGTSTGIGCPIGTYRDALNGQSSTDCSECPEGEKCPHIGSILPSGNCQIGYYCPAGSDTDREYVCPAGSQCPAHSPSHQVCSAGHYQPFENQGECLNCPSGYYCPSSGMTIPTICPDGYYCPEGTGVLATENKCAVGTQSDLLGLSLATQCQDCSFGKYCGSSAATSYTGACEAGYFCFGQSTNVLKTEQKCTEGTFCLPGAAHPSYCPPGTKAIAATSTRSLESISCVDCSPGEYCPSFGLKSTEALTCPMGYLCGAGSTHPAALDNGTISLCPAGSKCTDGISSVQCPIGYYQPMEGQGVCLQCPSGTECPTLGMTAPKPCSPGHYCNLLSSSSQPCPAGRYGPLSFRTASTECPSCPAGYYCSGPTSEGAGRSEPDGPCEAGYLCFSGSSSATPADDGTNGPCPKGHYCPSGTPYPVPCPRGTYQPNTQSTSCLSCPANHYCPNQGMSDAAADLPKCADGYVCLTEATTDKPTDGVTGRLCQAGYYCTSGAENQCPAGQYGPRKGQTSCVTCPQGYICSAGSSAPELCPNGYYCLAGRSTGVQCNDGAYTPTSTYGLETADQCTPCPTGKYCKGSLNEATGVCSEGSYCISGASVATATADSVQYIASGTIAVGVIPCPAGFYCTSGVTLPVACPDGTYSAAGSKTEADCSDCEAGYFCRNGTKAELPCPGGHYCDGGDSTPIPCPRGTYFETSLLSTSISAKKQTQCRNCERGFFCREEGISDRDNYLCAPGHYCEEKAMEQIPCPAGTFRDSRGGKDIGDCEECNPGSYCPTTGTVTPLICPNGTYCPRGSINFQYCEPGKACPAGTENQEEFRCPQGFYCPSGSEAYIKCRNGTYCEEGSSFPVPCPAGTFGAGAAVSSTIEQACTPCGRGMYSIESAVRKCDLCTPGYVCTGGTSTPTPMNNYTQGGYICPPGHYCPLGSFNEIKCPPGTYRAEEGAERKSDCTRCKIGFYNPIWGQAGCKKCGPSATTTAEGDPPMTCTCVGKNRRFIKSSGSCLCEAGYRPKNGEAEGVDSAEDCELIIQTECSSGQEAGVDGQCVDSQSVCPTQCNGNPGVLVEGTGLCQCEGTTDAESKLSQEFIASQPKASLREDGTVIIDGEERGDISQVPGFSGSAACSSGGSCSTVSLGRDSSGSFTADYGVNAAIEGSSSGGRRRLSRRLQGDSQIQSPVLCLQEGTIVFFSVDSGSKGYPVYVKDSILNTNQDFDRSPFDELAELVQKDVMVTVFSYEFTEKGIYVFSDSNDAQKLTVVAVMGEGESCPNPDAPIMSMSASSLSSVGIESQPKHIEPNWQFIIASFAVLMTVNFGIVAGFIFLHHRNVTFMKLTGGGDSKEIYQDKIAQKEQEEATSWFQQLLPKVANFMEKKESKPQGPKYDDLKRLLDQFKEQKEVLRKKLELQRSSRERERREEAEAKALAAKDALVEERLRALQDLKDYVRVNQDSLREHLGLNPVIRESEDMDDSQRAELAKQREKDEIRKNLQKMKEHEQQREEDWEHNHKKLQQEKFGKQIEDSDQIRNELIADLKEKKASKELTNDETQALIGEVDAKLTNLYSLMKQEEESQNQVLNEALERRKRRRQGLEEKQAALLEAKHRYDEKYGQKLKGAKDRVDRAQNRLEGRLDKERQEGVKSIEADILNKREKAVEEFQKQLRDAKSKQGKKGEEAFGAMLDDYKGKVEQLEKDLKAEQEQQKAKLEEKLAARRREGQADIEDAHSLKEKDIVVKMKNKVQGLGSELSTVQKMLRPIYDVESRLQAVGAKVQEEVKAIEDQERERSMPVVDIERKQAQDELDQIREEQAELEGKLVAVQDDQDHEIKNAKDRIQIEMRRTKEKEEEKAREREELKKRAQQASDEGEKRRLLQKLEKDSGDWDKQLSKETALQHDGLKKALEQRRQKKKEIQQALSRKKEEDMLISAGLQLEDLQPVNQVGEERDDQGKAEEKGRILADNLAQEFTGEGEALQAAESYFDEAHQKEMLELMNAMFDQRGKNLKKMLFDLITQKQSDLEDLRNQFEPQVDFLKERKAKGMMKAEDYRERVEKLADQQSEQKMDIEIEFAEREQALRDQYEEQRLQQEAKLKQALKARQYYERTAALQQLVEHAGEDEQVKAYVEEQEDLAQEETKKYLEQLYAEQEQQLTKLEEDRQRRVREMKEKEEQILQRELAETVEAKEKALERQKERMLRQRQEQQDREHQQAKTKEESAHLLLKHKEDFARFEEALSKEQQRQMDAVRKQIERRKRSGQTKVSRQIQMAAIIKQKESYKEHVGSEVLLDDSEKSAAEVRAALAKCESKASHFKRLAFKGSFSLQDPVVFYKETEKEIGLKKRLEGQVPPPGIVFEKEQDQESLMLHTGRESRSTIVLSERPPPEKVSFKDVYSFVERVETKLKINADQQPEEQQNKSTPQRSSTLSRRNTHGTRSQFGSSKRS